YGSLTRLEKCWTGATPDAVSPRRWRHRRWSRPPAPSIFLLEVLLHVLAHLDQTAPNLLEERDHLVDLGIARQLELSLAGLCARRSRNAGPRQPTGQQFLLHRRILALQAADLGLQRRALVGHYFAGPAGIAAAALRDLAGAGVEPQHAVGHGIEAIAAILAIRRR